MTRPLGLSPFAGCSIGRFFAYTLQTWLGFFQVVPFFKCCTFPIALQRYRMWPYLEKDFTLPLQKFLPFLSFC